MKKRGREGRDTEIIFGINPIAEALKAGRRKVFRVVCKLHSEKNKAIQSIISLAGRKSIPVEYRDIEEVARMANAEGHQGIAAHVSMPVYSKLDNLVERALKSEKPTLAVLDSVADPRNLGAVIRSAEALGLDGVIFPSDRSASYTPVAAKASAGAGEHMSLCVVTNIAETIRRLRDDGFTCVALDGDAETELTTFDPGPLAIVLGSEGAGARPLVIKRCDYVARIPMRGRVSSLNVSTAAAIAFYIATLR